MTYTIKVLHCHGHTKLPTHRENHISRREQVILHCVSQTGTVAQLEEEMSVQQDLDGKWTRKSLLMDSLTIFNSEIFVNFFKNIFMVPAFKQSVGNLFHSFLCENEYFLISNLHCSFTNTLYPLVLVKREKNIFINIFIPIQYLKNLNLISL